MKRITIGAAGRGGSAGEEPPIDSPPSPPAGVLAQIDALGNAGCLRTIAAIARFGRSTPEGLSFAVQLPASEVEQHLELLVAVGLVRRASGRYALDVSGIDQVIDYLSSVSSSPRGSPEFGRIIEFPSRIGRSGSRPAYR